MPTNLTPRRRRILAFAPALLVLGMGIATTVGLLEVRMHRGAVAHGREVLLTSGTVLQRLTDAETGQRGFVITGDTSYLGAYHGARADAMNALASLSLQVRGNVSQESRVAALDRVVRRRLDVLDGRIAVRQRAGFDSARVAIMAGGGLELMSQARTLLRELQDEEAQHLEQQSTAEDRSAALLFAFVIVGSLLAALLSGRLNAVLSRATVRLTHQNEQLREQAVELEAQNQQLEEQAVELETQAAELEAANEELQVTTEELEERTALSEQLRVEAESANRAKSEFLAMMSHELRTPLNAIAGYVDLMEAGLRGALTEQQLDDLRRIKLNGQHLLAIINDVLNFARLEAGQVELSLQEVPLGVFIDDLHSIIAPLLDTRGLHYQVRSTCGEARCTASALADAERLRQVMVNLLSNAIKFTPEGGTITVECDCGGSDLVVRVSDTGIGIPAERLENIFEPFVQVSRISWGSREGIGLGLAISRDLARRMGGELTAQSRVDEGSTFTLRLPRARQQSVQSLPGSRSAAGASAALPS